MSDRPNILWIMADQHHAACLGFQGHPDVRTPNLDALAGEGVVFDQCFAQNGVCVPSRVCYLTGQYCHSHGVYGNDHDPIPESLTALPRLLQTQGYQTALIGKKHLPNWQGHGFEYQRLCYTADGPTRALHYYNYLKQLDLHHLYDDLGDVERFCLSDREKVPVEHSLEVWTGDETISYLRGRSPQQPFFLMCSFERPHPPLTVPAGCPHVYDPAALTLPPNQQELTLNEGIFFDRNVELKWCRSVHGEAGLREGLAAYYALISLIDEQIGRILTTLDELGLRDDTLIVFCADHGDYAGEYSRMAKGWCYDAIHRVPFVWSWPGRFRQGAHRQGLVEAIDFFPTICRLLDLPVPRAVQGRDLGPSLTGDADRDRDAVFWEFAGVKTVRTATHKLNYAWDGEQQLGELFDLAADPHEYDNRFDDPTMAPVREALLRRLLDWWIATEQPGNWAPSNEHYPPSRWYRTHDRPDVPD